MSPSLQQDYARMVRFAARWALPDMAADAVHDALVYVCERGLSWEDVRLVPYTMTRIRRECLDQVREVARQRYLEACSAAFLDRADGHLWEALEWAEDANGAIRQGRRNSLKAACPRGHRYTEDNTYRHPNGQRVCLECRRAANAAARARRAEQRTTCRNGHPLTAELARLDSRGHRRCAACLTAPKRKREEVQPCA